MTMTKVKIKKEVKNYNSVKENINQIRINWMEWSIVALFVISFIAFVVGWPLLQIKIGLNSEKQI